MLPAILKQNRAATRALRIPKDLFFRSRPGPKILAVTSGKGGVGKTNVVANLSVSLSELGKKVVVLDADFGLANLDVLLGLTPRYHLGHVLFGNKTLTEIMVQGPKGIRIIPASSGLQRMSELTSGAAESSGGKLHATWIRIRTISSSIPRREFHAM